MAGVRWLPVVLVLLLGVIAAPAAGQVFVEADETRLHLEAGTQRTVNVTFENPTNRSYFVAGSASGNLSDATTLEPRRFPLGPNGEARTTAILSPPESAPVLRGDQILQFTIVDRDEGTAFDRRIRLDLSLEPPALYLGAFENPLPPGFDSDRWLFGLELVTWLAAAGLLVAVLGTLVHWAAPRAGAEVHAEMTRMIKLPTAYVIAVLGLNHSWRLIPRSPFIDVLDRFLEAIAIIVVGALAYRAVTAGLYYYGQNIAAKTETEVDDVLVPVLEKLGAAVIVAVAAFYAFQTLGVDFSFLVAGGLVAGLVISMAAQDTLSNLFSGMHILLDRPFREGDVIKLESGEVCRVDRIGLRSTDLYHFQNHQEIIAPNNELATKRIVNMSYPDRNYRITLPISVEYGTDLEEARHLIHNVAMDTEEVLKGRTTQPRVFVKGFGESGIELELRAYVPDERDRNLALTTLHTEIEAALTEAGITIPYPQRVVHMRE